MADSSEKIASRTPSKVELQSKKNEAEDDLQSQTNRPEESKLQPMSWRQRILALTLGLSSMASTLAYSQIAPFFPNEARQKNVSQTQVGIIFGIFELTMFLASPLFGHFLSRIGYKFMYVTGVICAGITTLMFSVVLRCPDSSFVGLCIALRVGTALGEASYYTASYAAIGQLYPERLSILCSLCETFGGIGYALGPFLGGTLYEYGGFGAPFYFLGTLMLLFAVPSFFLLPDSHTLPSVAGTASSDPVASYTRILKIPSVSLLIYARWTYAAALAFLDPTLEPFMSDKFDSSAFQIGLVFLLCSAIYVLATPLFGWFVQKNGHGYESTVISVFCVGIGYLIIGPSPIFNNAASRLNYVLVAMAMIGLFSPPTMVVPFVLSVEEVQKRGFPDSVHTHGIIGGAMASATSLGAFIGPTLGSLIAEKSSFEWASTFMAILQFLACVILIAHLMLKRRSSGSSVVEPETELGKIPEAEREDIT